MLGVDRRASAETIRGAYRDLARRLHPDRVAAGGAAADLGAGRTMATVNEAYRVLSDPARRVVYDRSLDVPEGSPPPTGSAAPSSGFGAVAEPPPMPRHTFLSPAGPARVPWKLMGVLALVGSAAVLVSSLFDGPARSTPPDGLLQVGSCIAIEPNGDAREVACTNGPVDTVVDVLVPLDAPCPAGTETHRDRQGIVTVCLRDE